MTNTALQVIDFDFYGDKLIALQDNATGEIYTAINSVLRGIGFTERQVRHNREKWTKDKLISKRVLKFNIPSNGGIDAIEHNKDVRKLFEKMVDSLLEKYNLINTEEPVKHKTIFDK